MSLSYYFPHVKHSTVTLTFGKIQAWVTGGVLVGAAVRVGFGVGDGVSVGNGGMVVIGCVGDG